MLTLTLPSPSQLLGKAGISPLPGSVRLGAPSPFPFPLCLQGLAGSRTGHSMLGPASAMLMDGGRAVLCRGPGGCRSSGGSSVNACPGHMAGGSCGVAGGVSGGGDHLALGRCSGLCLHVFATALSILVLVREQRMPGAVCATALGLGIAGAGHR